VHSPFSESRSRVSQIPVLAKKGKSDKAAALIKSTPFIEYRSGAVSSSIRKRLTSRLLTFAVEGPVRL